MRVLVCGGREYKDYTFVSEVLNALHKENGIEVVINGGARGADATSTEWAENHCVPFYVFPANWEAYGRSAGPIRNSQMLKQSQPNLVIAFPGGKGTAHMVEIAKRAGVEVVEY